MSGYSAMTVDPVENSGYAFRCAGLSGDALGSGKGMMARSVVLYFLRVASLLAFAQGGVINHRREFTHAPGAPSSCGSGSWTS